MTDNWGFYERQTHSEQLRILVNVGHQTSAPLPGYDTLLSISVNLYPVRESNRSRRELIERLERLESSLDHWLKREAEAIYVGRINTPTRLEFYYYGGARVPGDAAIRKWVESNPGFRVQHYTKPDPDWSFYRYLLPDQLEELYMHNAQMIYALIHKGDDIKQPRNVYHWLLFRREKDRQTMETKLRELGYRIEMGKESSEDDSFPYPLIISRYEDVRLDTVNERVRELHRLASGLEGRYDGWGSVMKLPRVRRLRQHMRKLVRPLEAIIRKGRPYRRQP
jgi:regulator of RNase E activity RraB